MTEPLLQIDSLSVHYRRGQHVTRAVDDVSLSIGPGETLGLVGESGSGKSTIGRAIVGLARATAGTIRFEGADITHADHKRRRELSSQIQVIFQDPYSSLNPSKTIRQTLVEPMIVHADVSKSERDDRVVTMLGRVGLPAAAADRYPAQFSGGQRQRIAIARALMLSPKLVICDEPVSALDLSIQAQIMNLLADLQAELGVSYLFIAHDLAVVRHLSHRTVVLYQGRIMESGDAAEVADSPVHPYSQALVEAAPMPDPVVQRRRALERDAAAEVGSRIGGAQSPDSCGFAPRCRHAIEACVNGRPDLRTVGDRLVACIRTDELAPISQHIPQVTLSTNHQET
jgi:oligopeptide/dipeptide ABC transporter ATP-binding protein